MKELKDLIIKLENMTSFQKRVNSQFRGDNLMATYQMKVEDGILDNIHNANNHQLNTIMNGYKWKYYVEYNDTDLLANEVRRRIRTKKLEKLC